MKRKPARQLLKSIATLRATIRSSRELLARRLAERPAACRPAAGATADYRPVFDHFDAELAATRSELAAAEDTYDVSQAISFEARQARDRVASQVHDQHTSIERFCRSQPQLNGVGIVGPTPRNAEALALQVSWTLDFLRDFERNPRPLVGGAIIDAGVVADDLETGLPLLKAAIVTVAATDADVLWARQRANRVFAEACEVLSWVARTYGSLGGLAGEDGIAERVQRCGG